MTTKTAGTEFYWFIGQVEDINDPLQMGRVRVRAFVKHTSDKNELPTNQLPWAVVSQNPDFSTLNGVGLSPTGIESNTVVWGYFADHSEAQIPIIIGALAGSNDISQLAKGINTLSKNLIGPEPKSQYAAKYPDNKVYTSKSGHVIEVDDTNGAERIQVYHKSGSYIEISPDGQLVIKSAAKGFYITSDDNTTYIDGDDNVTITGGAVVNINGQNKVNIVGKNSLTVIGNQDTTVIGDYNLTALGTVNIKGASLNMGKIGLGDILTVATTSLSSVVQDNISQIPGVSSLSSITSSIPGISGLVSNIPSVSNIIQSATGGVLGNITQIVQIAENIPQIPDTEFISAAENAVNVVQSSASQVIATATTGIQTAINQVQNIQNAVQNPNQLINSGISQIKKSL